MQGKNDAALQGRIEKRLSKLTDPGTGLDVLRMGLIRDLTVSDGVASLVFGPSSRHCPIAFRIGSDVYDAVRSVPGIYRVVVRAANFERAAELEELLRTKERDRVAQEAHHADV